MVLSQQLTKEPSERLCLMEEPPSDKIFICPPFACITLLIFFIHSVFSLALSAFKTTALWAAREKDIVIKTFSETSIKWACTKMRAYLSKQFYTGLY